MNRATRKLNPDAPPETKHRSRKDRKRWCKGRPGVEHAIVELDLYDSSAWRRRFTPEDIAKMRQRDAEPLIPREWRPEKLIVLECTTCGRVLGYGKAEA